MTKGDPSTVAIGGIAAIGAMINVTFLIVVLCFLAGSIVASSTIIQHHKKENIP